MKKLTQWMITLIVALNTAALAEDCALTERYLLLTDMKVAKEQQSLVLQMQELFNDKNTNTQAFATLQEQFDRQLSGLIHGDKSLKLEGTTLPSIRLQLDDTYKAWQETQHYLTQASSDKALQSFRQLLSKVNASTQAYDESYERYKQRSQFSSLISRHNNDLKIYHIAFNMFEKNIDFND